MTTAAAIARTGVGDTVLVTVPVTLDRQTILNLFVTMWEGGALGWAPDITEGPDAPPARPGESTAEYFARLVLDGSTIRILEAGDRPLGDPANVWHILDRDKLLRGISTWIARGCPGGEIITDDTVNVAEIDADIIVADLIFQYAVFGEVIYG